MRRVLIVDSWDFERRIVSVDLTPDPVPVLSDLTGVVREYADTFDTVLFLEAGSDPIVLKSPELNLGQFPWKRLESVLSGEAERAKFEWTHRYSRGRAARSHVPTPIETAPF